MWQHEPMKDLGQYFTTEEIGCLLKACIKPRDYALFFVLARTGRRVSEVCRSLRLLDINFENNLIKWRILKKKESRKGLFYTLPVHPSVIEVLKSYIIIHRNKIPYEWSYIFPISRQWCRVLLQRIGQQAGIESKKLKPHTFRHTFAIQCTKKGVPITIVRDLLAHSDINLTLFYQRFTVEDIKKNLEVVWG